MKPLFIPLKTEYFEAFVAGTKTEEIRRYGQVWNATNIQPGRLVTLSHGYGKGRRLSGVVKAVRIDPNPRKLPGWLECYPNAHASACAFIITIGLFSRFPYSEKSQ